jgi:hypothetical protein
MIIAAVTRRKPWRTAADSAQHREAIEKMDLVFGGAWRMLPAAQ